MRSNIGRESAEKEEQLDFQTRVAERMAAGKSESDVSAGLCDILVSSS